MIDTRPGITGFQAVIRPAMSDLGVFAGYGSGPALTGQSPRTGFPQVSVLTEGLSGQTEIRGSQPDNSAPKNPPDTATRPHDTTRDKSATRHATDRATPGATRGPS